MDYNTWKSTLFEEVYPQAFLTYGTLSFDKEDEDRLNINWGHKTLSIDINDFYNDNSVAPLKEIKKWVYSNVDAISEELEEAYVVYNHITNCFDAHIVRPLDTCSILKDVNPANFSSYGVLNRTRKVIRTQMEGTVLCLHSSHKNVPSLLAISHKDVFAKIIGENIDYSDDMAILLPDSIQTDYIFAGHPDSLRRFSENFPEANPTVIKAGDWFKILELKAKGKHV